MANSTLGNRWLLAGLTLVVLGALAGAGMAQWRESYEGLRLKMVDEQIVQEGIRSEAVLQAMREVPRHLFVSPGSRAAAYRDGVVDIGHKQTLSPAYIIAYMTEAIDPQPTDRVLEIGTGSGYQAAVLSKLVKEVYTIEIVEPLGREAAERLQLLGYRNVHVRVGDGFQGWADAAPFDKILVTCSPEQVPQPLLDQLRDGGKLIAPLGERYQQTFYLFEKHNGTVSKTRLLPTMFVPMTGIAEAERKMQPDAVHPRLHNGNLEARTNGALDAWYYLRQATPETGDTPFGRKPFVTFRNQEPGRDSHMLQAVAIDGTQVQRLSVRLWVRTDRVTSAKESEQTPALVVHFFDAQNRRIGREAVGQWLGTSPWTPCGRDDIPVPRESRWAIVQVGLRGATGALSVTDIQLDSMP
jgi:protein-L-isoaspartate(D-aspartate) O-methyltransferase